MYKKAEKTLIDADIFPRESLIERLSRKFGQDSVALSGPCEGQSLVKCICDQLEKRWESIKEKYASQAKVKVHKVATILGESFMKKDDTEICVNDLRANGYKKEAAKGITEYLKAYAMDSATDEEFNNAMDDTDKDLPSEPNKDVHLEDETLDDTSDSEETTIEIPNEVTEEINEMNEMDETSPVEEDHEIESSEDHEVEGPIEESGKAPEEMISIELPLSVVEEIKNAIQPKAPENTENENLPVITDEEIDMNEPQEFELDIQVEKIPGGDLHGEVDQETETVDLDTNNENEIEEVKETTEEIVPGEPDTGDKKQFVEGAEILATNDNHEENEEEAVEDIEEAVDEFKKTEETEEVEGETEEVEEDEEESIEKMDKSVKKLKKGEEEEEEEEDSEGEDEEEDKKDKKKKKKASNNVTIKKAETFNTTDQLAGHDDKQLGKAKNKCIKDPKALTDIVDKVQSEKLDAKKINRSEFSKSDAGLSGPEVPAGSSPIGNETQTGGNTDITGTVVATIIPNIGIMVEANGKKLLAKVKVPSKNIEKLQTSIASLNFDGDLRKFASAVCKTAKEECCTTNTSEMEAKNFQNNAGAKASKPKTKPVQDPKAVQDNFDTEGHTGGDKVQEKKLDAETVTKKDVCKCETVGEKPEVPSETGNLSTKGTVAEHHSQKREVSAEALQAKLAEAKIEKQRAMAASFYVADLLRHGEITEAEYSKELEKTAAMTIPQIQNLIASTKKARERVAAKAVTASNCGLETKVASLSIPVVVSSASSEKNLTQKLVENFKLTRDLDALDQDKSR